VAPSNSRNGPTRNPISQTRENDVLIGADDRGITFLGRDGIDVFQARNGKYDKITVGGGRKNKVIADRKDKILWGWGYAAF